ncbi:MAG: type II toxin-antitoxin system VapB family antitoxin [Acidobacteriota bacterium]|nr:type II toxin-antitoxin system VapB family antitoxin [Acidobacteriota bacterium]
MALNIKNAEVESLAAEVAKLARESKTEAIRVALKERAFRLKSYGGKLSRGERIDAALERFREEFPNGDFGRPLTKEEEERILGFGPDGV